MLMVWLLAIPLVGGFAVLWAPERVAKNLAAVVAGLNAVWFAGLVAVGQQGVNWNWISAWGIRFHLVADGLALFLIGLTAVMVWVAVLASSAQSGRTYFFWLLFMEFGAIGLFASVDLFVFYVFWEAILIPIFFLLSARPGAGRAAALKWLVANLAGSLFMLVGIIAVAVIHNQVAGQLTFEIGQLAGMPLGPGAAAWIFASFFIAFAIKSPLWPVHGWMPDVYREAPAPVTALLSGVLSKAGIYGMLRVLLPLFGPEVARYQNWLLAIAAATLVYGALMALRHQDMKMVVGYGSLSHMGMMALGVFSLTPVGVLGATFEMVAHGLIAGGLFVIVGWVEERAGGRDLSAIQGMNASAPRLAAYFLLFALAMLGLPGLPGFAGEFMIIQGLIGGHWPFAAVAAVVLVVASWYMLRVFQGTMQGPAPASAVRDLAAGQLVWIVPLAGLVVLLGVWPAGITGSVTPSLYHAVHVTMGRGVGGL